MCRRELLQLLLLLPLLLISICATCAQAQNRTTISLAILWDFNEATTEFQRIFQNHFQPSLKTACPATATSNKTDFFTTGFAVDSLPTVADLQGIEEFLTSQQFLFIGYRKFILDTLLIHITANTTIAEIPNLKWIEASPMPQNHVNDAILKVMRQRISEGQFPSNLKNYEAAFILQNTVTITDLNPLFSFFTQGSVYYIYNKNTIEADLLSIKYAGIINIIAIVNELEGDVIKETAFSLSMFDYQYRWIFHGPRLINPDFDSRMDTHSTNITSIEFGRVADTLRKDLRTSYSVLLYDLLSAWQPYLTAYLCERSLAINTTVKGYSGIYKILPFGEIVRSRWDLQIYRGFEGEKTHIGEWHSEGLFNMLSFKDPLRNEFQALLELKRNPFRMVTVIAPPYVFFDPAVSERAPMKDRLRGMYIEICKHLMESMTIKNYDFFLQPDASYGDMNVTWNGMIRTVLDGKAHMACAPLSIERLRKTAVTFTRVIHSSRESVLYRLPVQDPMVELFQFIQPLDGMIWLSIFGVLFFVAIVLAIMHAIIPNNGINLSLYNSVYFSFAEVVQGTSGAVPKQLSGRIVVAFFWFFTLFLLLAYIANYAAFRTLEGVKPQITSLKTVLQNNEYSFGALRNTVTVNLLKSSTFVYMQQAYKLMLENFENGLVANESVALDLIKSSPYALINDNLQNQYLAETNCNLASVGDFYRLKNAMAVPNGSEYLQMLDRFILSSSQNYTEIQQRYFTVPTSSKPDCQDRSLLGSIRSILPANLWQVKPDALTLANTMGIALINLVGCCIALALSGVERCFSGVLEKRRDSRRETQRSEAYSMAQRPTMRE